MSISYKVLVETLNGKVHGLEDLYLISDIFDKQQKFHYSLDVPCKDRFLEYTLDDVSDYIESCDNSIIIVALYDDIIVGFINIINYDNDSSIEDIFVDEKYRGMSIGSELMRRGLDWMKDKSIKRLNVNIIKGNEKVFKFYSKFGLCMDGYTFKKEI